MTAVRIQNQQTQSESSVVCEVERRKLLHFSPHYQSKFWANFHKSVDISNVAT